MPPAIERRLRESRAASLRLQVDDQLVHVPWELMHDGTEFLGIRFIQVEQTEWYAPGVGLVKRVRTESTTPSAMASSK